VYVGVCGVCVCRGEIRYISGMRCTVSGKG
jgi:hypothetical protein